MSDEMKLCLGTILRVSPGLAGKAVEIAAASPEKFAVLIDPTCNEPYWSMEEWPKNHAPIFLSVAVFGAGAPR